MPKKKPKSINYYFLQKHLHPKSPSGYEQVLVNMVVNKNESENNGKYLFVQENNKKWGFPMQEVEEKNLIDGFFDSMAKNLGEKLGFRGMKIIDLKPQFKQKSYFFDFAKQVFDEKQSEEEMQTGGPSKGRIFHLAIITYEGPEDLPLDKKDPGTPIRDYKWVNETEARSLVQGNVLIDGDTEIENEVNETDGNALQESIGLNFEISLFENIVNAYKEVLRIFSGKNPYQQTLL